MNFEITGDEDIDKLEKAIKANQESKLIFYLGTWRCGSSACFVGAYIDGDPDCELNIDTTGHLFSDDGESGVDAVANHFRIGRNTAIWLFGNKSYSVSNDRKMVIERVRFFIEQVKQARSK